MELCRDCCKECPKRNGCPIYTDIIKISGEPVPINLVSKEEPAEKKIKGTP